MKGARAVVLSLLVNLLLFSSIPFLLKGEVREEGALPAERVRVRLKPFRPPESPERPVTKPITRAQVQRAFDLQLPDPPLVVPTEPPFAGLTIDFSLPPPEIRPSLASGPSLPPFPRPEGPFERQEVDEPPVPVFQVRPVYPLVARRKGIEGVVRLKFLVDRRGQVGEVQVLRASPKGYFERAAQEAVRRWRFIPGKVGGEPVETWMVVTIRFQLEGG